MFEGESNMLKQSFLAIGLLAFTALPATDALAKKQGANPKSFQLNYDRAYSRAHRHANPAAAYHPAPAASPFESIGAAALGAIYGYWSDGEHVYGGDPCYVYNDRDWEFQRVC